MANPYEIDFEPAQLAPGVSMLLDAIGKRRDRERADRNAATQEEFAKRGEARENNRLYYERKTFERQAQHDQDEVFKSANLLFEQGDTPGALSLLKRHGIKATPEAGAPTTTPAQVMTPLDVMKGIQQPAMGPEAPPPNPGLPGSPLEGPAAPADAGKLPTPTLPTPVSIMQRAYQGTHTGTSVPEETPPTPQVEPPTIGPGHPLGNAEADILPLTLEQAHTTPGGPTGAYAFKGSAGEDLGRYDPAALEAHRKEKADRVGEALGPLGKRLDVISRLVAEGDLDPKVASSYLTSLKAEDTAAAKVTDREDKQAFTAGQNAKYRSEGLTFEQRKQLAEIMARAKTAAAGAGPVAPGVAELVGMKESGASDEEIYARAAQLHLSEKQVTAPVQNVVKNAAAGERAGQKREGLVATDETGRQIGTWKTPQAATVGTKQIESFAQARTRLRALIDDIKGSGSRVLTPDEIQNRLSKAQSVAAAMRVYNGLGATDASQRLESDIMGAVGAPGHGWLMGANLGVVERILHEAEDQHQVQLHTKLRPGGSSSLAPALGGPRHGQGEASHPSQAPVGETRTGPDGRTYRKVGPNNWQPVAQ